MLQQILDSTQQRVVNLKERYNLKYFEDTLYFHSPTLSLTAYLLNPSKNGIIAEFKRVSPSKGVLNEYAPVHTTTLNYMRAGCSALSIITEPHYFKGNTKDLTIARQYNLCPILRKDFIVDPIQLYESKAIGADAVLLLAKALSKAQLNELTALAKALQLEVLLEVDDVEQLDKIQDDHHLIGINSRNLSSMAVQYDRLTELYHSIPSNRLVIAESGIDHPDKLVHLRSIGFNGFLIGSAFMSAPDPGLACMRFTSALQKLQHKELCS
jgi:indole-3-glycerol phosphate synthase